jgi:hypothetical protein
MPGRRNKPGDEAANYTKDEIVKDEMAMPRVIRTRNFEQTCVDLFAAVDVL